MNVTHCDICKQKMERCGAGIALPTTAKDAIYVRLGEEHQYDVCDDCLCALAEEALTSKKAAKP